MLVVNASANANANININVNVNANAQANICLLCPFGYFNTMFKDQPTDILTENINFRVKQVD